MKPAYENLLTPPGQSFRCFNRETLCISTRWHCHPELELTYVERGYGTRIVGDNISSYGDHDLVLLGPNLPHTWHSDAFHGRKLDQHPAIVVQFRLDFLGGQFFEAAEFTAIRQMLEKANRGLKFSPEIALQIGGKLGELMEASPTPRLLKLLEILATLAETPDVCPLASVGFSRPPNSQAENRTQRICSFIGEHYRDPELTHQVLAEEAGMNASAFSRFFRESTGKTAMNYIAEMRVSLACRLLADSDMPIAEIYRYAGFTNNSNFNRQFQRFRKMSAREYRKRHREVAGIADFGDEQDAVTAEIPVPS
ncbi:MAG TPA: AraC family transcriptional regulator [Planctomicrobium sp.]|nr:AraC family transcriptional regulator [Planctomicrobium sp.]